jgi:transcriptional regulator with XRE-family HTH domain
MAGLEQSVGRSVRRARKLAGLTQEMLAQKLRVDAATVSRYETASLAFSLEMLERVAHVLQVTVASLVDGRSTLPTLRHDEEDLVRRYRSLSPGQRRITLGVIRVLQRTK